MADQAETRPRVAWDPGAPNLTKTQLQTTFKVQAMSMSMIGEADSTLHRADPASAVPDPFDKKMSSSPPLSAW